MCVQSLPHIAVLYLLRLLSAWAATCRSYKDRYKVLFIRPDNWLCVLIVA